MNTTATERLANLDLPYQIERIELGENGLTITYTTPEDLANPHVIEFRTAVINASHEELAALMIQLLHHACELVDAALVVKRQPAPTKAPRVLAP